MLFGALALSTQTASAASCSFDSGSPGGMAFPSYDPTSGTSVTGTATIAFACKGGGAGTTATFSANGGKNGTVSARNMLLTGGSDLLPYILSLSASYSPVFGDGTSGTQTYSFVWTGSQSGSFTVYGKINGAIPGGAGDVHAGSYTDSVTITITF